MKNEKLKNLIDLAVFNKGTGTVTIPYDAYMLMHTDSVYWNIVRATYKNGGAEKATEYMLSLLEEPLVGTGFARAQPPMCDVEAIAYLYNLPVDYIEKYILEV